MDLSGFSHWILVIYFWDFVPKEIQWRNKSKIPNLYEKRQKISMFLEILLFTIHTPFVFPFSGKKISKKLLPVSKFPWHIKGIHIICISILFNEKEMLLIAYKIKKKLIMRTIINFLASSQIFGLFECQSPNPRENR